jgi:hypothetical protein
MRRSMHRSVAAALLAPMLLLAISAWGFVGLRCRVTGMISVATCCPGAGPNATRTPAALDDPGCCERIVVDNNKPPVARSARPETIQPPPLALVPAEIPIAFLRPGSTLNTEFPPPFRPPLSLLNRLLI